MSVVAITPPGRVLRTTGRQPSRSPQRRRLNESGSALEVSSSSFDDVNGPPENETVALNVSAPERQVMSPSMPTEEQPTYQRLRIRQAT